ncbi:DUF6864 domain-containing function [Microbulbifer sp. GL-2]|uniref:DUF6864 domain-containing function n=1 Tax=Microbulbifer sp. GL-2 TaxID=2591606 RepID=UPI0011645124|nr:hypothetical protein [Microbulbifer sp. GL-2]BBM00447.1 hypothetical protein GL2_05210 [Microbulbifer sp. GL-2]
MKIYHGDFRIIESGTLESSDLSDTRFVLSESPLLEVIFRISLEGKESSVDLDLLNPNTLAIVFSNPDGVSFGPAEPIRIGHLNGKQLFVLFRTSLRGGTSSYGLEYTFYTKEVS